MKPPECRRLDVVIDVPLDDGTVQQCLLTQGGDCSAAHSASGIDSPVCRKGCCFRCCARKGDWFDLERLKHCRRRNFAYQCAANHINPWPLLGEKFKDRPPAKCPHCAVLLDAAHMEVNAENFLKADEAGRKEILRLHSNSHDGAMLGLTPVTPMDPRARARSALHRRMNACSNNITCTFMKVEFCKLKRKAANVLLAFHDILWTFPDKNKKQRATTPVGNDARAFHTNDALLVGLFKIFYPEACADLETELQALGEAAANNTNMQGGLAAAAGPTAGRQSSFVGSV